MKTAVLNLSALTLALGGAFATLPAAAAEPTAKPQKVQKAAGDKGAAGSAVRNWADVDTDRDGLVSPEEMERYLAASSKPSK